MTGFIQTKEEEDTVALFLGSYLKFRWRDEELEQVVR